MVFDILLFVLGLALLYFGADWLIRGAASLALRFGIRPLIVGLTVVALGTSMPEFIVNFFAAVAGEDGLALGNVIGSNIANIALILGVSALVFPMNVSKRMLFREYPILVAIMFGFYYLASDGMITKSDGIMLVLALVVFLIYIVLDSRKTNKASVDTESVASEALLPTWKKVLFLVGGIALLSGGARLMVLSAIDIAEFLGVSSAIVGLTVVAIGTSLPELAASVMCAMREEVDLSFGNVLGSNILNVLFVIGLIALIRPLQVDTESIEIHMPIMLAFTVALLPIARTQYQITRVEGGLLVAGFIGYLYYLILPHV
ncbi:MAG: calcium/sodium antiporter [Bacteroidetes bacterium]|nr:calcium/sodium antiporter [Bacteroidota bacterium]